MKLTSRYGPRLRARFMYPLLLCMAVFIGGCGGQRAAPASTFLLLNGSTLTTSELRGKVVLVNFWATSCTSCVAEMPDLIATHEKYADRGFETIAVAMSYDPPAFVVNFADSRDLPFKVAIDKSGEVARQWGDVKLTPTTFVVNKKGQVLKSFVGPPDFVALHRFIDTLLAEPS